MVTFIFRQQKNCPELYCENADNYNSNPVQLSPGWVFSWQQLFPFPEREVRHPRKWTWGLINRTCLPKDVWLKTAPGEGPGERVSPVEGKEKTWFSGKDAWNGHACWKVWNYKWTYYWCANWFAIQIDVNYQFCYKWQFSRLSQSPFKFFFWCPVGCAVLAITHARKRSLFYVFFVARLTIYTRSTWSKSNNFRATCNATLQSTHSAC